MIILFYLCIDLLCDVNALLKNRTSLRRKHLFPKQALRLFPHKVHCSVGKSRGRQIFILYHVCMLKYLLPVV